MSSYALWWAVVVAGVYHGANPGMGWPLAVSGALMKERVSALATALLLLFVGHFLAMTVTVLPFAFSDGAGSYQRPLRIGAGLIVMAAGVYLLVQNRHPRFLSRISPSKIGLWSFMAAMAHGAGLMVVPILLGMSMAAQQASGDHDMGTMDTMGHQAGRALGVATVHSVAMFSAAAVMALLVYFWLGVGFLSKSWFNLDRVWAVSLVVVGAFGLYSAW